MKRTFALVFFAIMLLLCPVQTAFAEDSAGQLTSDLAEDINSSVGKSAGEEARSVLGDFELDVGDPDSLDQITLGSLLSKIAELFFGSLKKPSQMLGRLIAAAVLCSLAQNMTGAGSELTETYRLLGSLAAVLAVCGCLSESIERTTECLNELTLFMLSYIPVFAGITTASGHAASGAAYYGTDLFLCECVSFAARSIITPLLSVLAAVCVVGAVNPDIKLGNAAAAVKRVINWLLGILMTLFTGLLAVKNTVGAAADSAGARTVRFVASSFIPVIGGSVSETYSAIKGSLGVIKAGTGSVGVIMIFAIVLRPLIIIIAARAVLALAKLCCDILGQNDIARLTENLGSVLAIGMSILICVSMMFIISTCIVMMTASGG